MRSDVFALFKERYLNFLKSWIQLSTYGIHVIIFIIYPSVVTKSIISALTLCGFLWIWHHALSFGNFGFIMIIDIRICLRNSHKSAFNMEITLLHNSAFSVLSSLVASSTGCKISTNFFRMDHSYAERLTQGPPGEAHMINALSGDFALEISRAYSMCCSILWDSSRDQFVLWKLRLNLNFPCLWKNDDKMTQQARSRGGSLGAGKSPFLNRRSISLLKRSTILLKKP